MTPQANTIVELEKKFWQSMVDNETNVALAMLCEPSLMISSRGTMKFSHADFKRMAEQGAQVLRDYTLSDMEVVFPNEDTAVLTYHARQTMAPRGSRDGETTQEMNDSSTWVRTLEGWKCAAHTESPASEAPPH